MTIPGRYRIEFDGIARDVRHESVLLAQKNLADLRTGWGFDGIADIIAVYEAVLAEPEVLARPIADDIASDVAWRPVKSARIYVRAEYTSPLARRLRDYLGGRWDAHMTAYHLKATDLEAILTAIRTLSAAPSPAPTRMTPTSPMCEACGERRGTVPTTDLAGIAGLACASCADDDMLSFA